jgi:Mrp family chromosome partitioning ATPase
MSTKIKELSDTENFVASSMVQNGKLNDTVSEVPMRAGSEHYDQLLRKLCKPIREAQGVGFLLGLTGCDNQTDSSVLAMNLAIRAAEQGMSPVLLIDANRRSPRLHQQLRMSNKEGLADILAGKKTIKECVEETSTEDLQVLTLGSEILWDNTPVAQQQFEGLLNELREDYLLVIINLQVADEMNHVLPLAQELDGTLMILRSEQVDVSTAQAAVRSLRGNGINPSGVVVTEQRQYLPNWAKNWL